MNTYRDSKKSGLKAKLAGIELRMSLLRAVMLGLLGVFLLIWAFFIGILVGRGDKPEDMVPEIAALMPSENATDPTFVINSESTQASEGKILQPENLGFMGNLKTKPSNDDLTNAPLATNIPTKQKPVPSVASEPKQNGVPGKNLQSDAKPQAKPQGQTQAQTQAQTQVQPKSEAQVAPGEDVFDYVYQVAASSDKNGAEGLKDKLIAKGLDAFVLEAKKDESTIYRINVRFRGSPDDTRKLTKDLQDAGIDRKILVTKTPTVN